MSRSRRPQCSVGRGCGCCGDAGASRRARERAWQRADSLEDGVDADLNTPDAKDTGGWYHHEPYLEHRR